MGGTGSQLAAKTSPGNIKACLAISGGLAYYHAMTFREQLRLLMQQKHMSAKTLAARTGISVNTLNMYIGYREAIPSAGNAVKIARALGVTVEHLVDGAAPALGREAGAAADSRAAQKARPSVYALIVDEIKKTPKESHLALLELLIRFNREHGKGESGR